MHTVIIWRIFSTFSCLFFCPGNKILILIGLEKLWISNKSWLLCYVLGIKLTVRIKSIILKPKKWTLIASFIEIFRSTFLGKSSITSMYLQLRLWYSGFKFFEYFSIELKIQGFAQNCAFWSKIGFKDLHFRQNY